MATISEKNNAGPPFFDPDTENNISQRLSNTTLFNNDGTIANNVFNPDSNNDGVADYKNLVAPEGLLFTQNSYLSNSVASTYRSINDFTAFNPYIHYTDAPRINEGLIRFGINIASNAPGVINIFPTLQKASVRFDLYNRQYRGNL